MAVSRSVCFSTFAVSQLTQKKTGGKEKLQGKSEIAINSLCSLPSSSAHHLPSFPSSVSHPHLLVCTEVANVECLVTLRDSAEGQGHSWGCPQYSSYLC